MKLDNIIDDSEIKQIVSTAILEKIGEKKRDILLRDAIAYLMTTQEREIGYGFDKKKVTHTPLTQMFHEQVKIVAKNIIIEWFENNEDVKKQISSMLSEAWIKFINEKKVYGKRDDGSDKTFVDILSASLANAITRSNDY